MPDKVRLAADEDTNNLVNHLLVQLERKLPRNLLRDRIYDGKNFGRLFKTGVVPLQYQNMGLVLGWSAKAVDIPSNRCNLEGFVWDDGDIDSLGAQEFAEANSLQTEMNQAITSMLLHSCVFAVNVEGDPNAGEAPSLLHYKDATNATGVWNTRTRRLDNLLSINDRDNDGKPTAFTLYERNLTRTWELNSVGIWELTEASTHDYGLPVDVLPYSPRLNRPFGRSRISRAVISAQSQALRSVQRMEGHMDVYSFPEFWMLGADASIFKDKEGNLLPEWKVMVGRIKGIPDDDEAENPRADVKQFAGSSPEPHLASLRQQAMFFSGETSIPLNSLGVADMANPTSADSYVASREDLISECEAIMDNISAPLRRRYITGLAMQNQLGTIPDSWKSIHDKWRSPIHLSRAAMADAGSKTVASVSWLAETEVGLELLGLTPDQIRRALAEKRRLQGSQVLQALRDSLAQPQGSPVPAEAQEVTQSADSTGFAA